MNSDMAKLTGTAGTAGTTLIIKGKSGPGSDSPTGTSGTSDAMAVLEPDALVPVVPTTGTGPGPEKRNDFNAVPVVPVVPVENVTEALETALAEVFGFEAWPQPREPAQPGPAPERLEVATPMPAPTTPDLDTFEERAAIREHDGGETRDRAERAAAMQAGFADPATMTAATVAAVAQHLEALAAAESDPVGRRFIAAAQRFVRDGHAAAALRAGWPLIELFGAPPSGWSDTDRMGAAFLPLRVVAVAAGTISFETGGARIPLHRAAIHDGAVLPWERAG